MLTPVAPHNLPDHLAGLLPRVLDGWAGVFHIEGTDADLVLSVGLTVDSGEIGLWIEDVEGTVGRNAKKNLTLMGAVLAECEAIARSCGCTEIRIEADTRASWKLRLLPRFGFSSHRAGDRMVMRKALLDG